MQASLSRLVVCGALSVLVAACAGSRPVDSVALSAEPVAVRTDPVLTLEPIVVRVSPARITEDEVICAEENVTGTHHSFEICESRALREAQRRSAQEWLRSGGFSGGGTVASGRRTRSARR